MPTKVRPQIGDAYLLKSPEDWEITPDDRQTIYKTIGGIYIDDQGIVDDGEIMGLDRVSVTKTSWLLIKGYWRSRTLVYVVNSAGENIGLRRVVVKSYKTSHLHPNIYVLNLELWNK